MPVLPHMAPLGFITAIVVNPSERRLPKRTSVQSSSKDILCIADMNLIAKQISLRLAVRDTKQKIEKLRNTIVTFMCPSADLT